MKKLIGLIIIVAIAGGAYYFLSPLFIDNEVNEEIPGLDLSSLNLDGVTESIMDKAKTMTMDDVKNLVQLPDQETIESMTEEARQSIERSIVDRMAGFDPVEVNEEMEDAMENPEMMETNEPTILRTGTFVDADSFHRGSGNAFAIELPDGNRIIRFEDFRVTNGPDLFVYLVKDTNDFDAGNINLGELKGNVGNQNYVIPADVDLNEYSGVVIWCRAFSVLFSPAAFTA